MTPFWFVVNSSSFRVPHPAFVLFSLKRLEKYQYRPPRQKIERLFCAARFSPEKGLTFAIQALRLLFDKGHDLELRLAGDGPSKAHLQELVNALRLADRVKFVGFLTKGLAVSAMEALAIGVPVTATNIACTSELIEYGRTGLLIRPSDPIVLADAVLRMIADHDFRLRAAAEGRKKAEREFDVDKETAKLIEALLQCCGSD